MKTINLIVAGAFLFSIHSQAGVSYLGKDDGQSVEVAVSTGKTTYKAGDQVVVTGSIKVIGKKSWFEDFFDWLSGNKSKGLLEEFKKEGIELAGSFPASAVDVSSQVVFKSEGRDEISFKYTSAAISPDDVNQFALKIFNNSHDKFKLKQLASIQGKLERRLAALRDLKIYYKKKNAVAKVIAVIEREIAQIEDLRGKIEDRLNTDDNLIAQNVYPLQVENKVAAIANVGTSINGFRFAISATPGVNFEKVSTDLIAKVSRIDKDQNDDFFKFKSKYGYLAEISRDGKVVGTSSLDSLKDSLSIPVSILDANRAQNNKFLLTLYRTEKGKKKGTVGSLEYRLRTIQDTVAPAWIIGGMPSGSTYSKEFPEINLSAKDSFGRIDKSTLSVKLSGTSKQGQNVVFDLTSGLGVAMDPTSTELNVTGKINSIEEGSYTFGAKVSDSSGSIASHSSSVVIDRTAPIITFGHVDGSESTTESFNLNVYITDASPVDSKIYLNGVQVGYSDLNGFQLPVALRAGLNNIRVVGVDKAGNISELTSVVVFDTTPPVIANLQVGLGGTIYTNVLPINIPISFSSSEILSAVLVNGTQIVVSENDLRYSGDFQLNKSESSPVKLSVKDIAGNETIISQNILVKFDNVQPISVIRYNDLVLTNKSSVSVTIEVADASPVWTKVIVNDVEIFQTRSKNFDYPFELNREGENTLKVVSSDEAGNSKESGILKVKRDTVAPILSDIIPVDGSIIDRIAFLVSGQSNEKLKSVLVNGVGVGVSSSGLEFNGQYVASNQGDLVLEVSAQDLAGNTATTNIDLKIKARLLIQELVSIVPDADGVNMWVIGASSSTRAKAEISVSASLFNGAKDYANSDGSFQVKIKNFSSVSVKSKDVDTGEQEQINLTYTVEETSLSGIVKDVEGTPLVNALISVSNSTNSVFTNSSGEFIILNPPTGDQNLIVNGSSVVIGEGDTGKKRYSTTFIAVNVGRGQKNVLERVVYLTPLLTDGSETQVTAGSAAVVTSPHAPGVSLMIPSNSTVFPGGGGSGIINMMTIKSSGQQCQFRPTLRQQMLYRLSRLVLSSLKRFP
ncbi:Ig-like domain repeat protein [Bdellovibrio sp. HCB274]|uniref:Ig-like domain repeat protein n=1 Tax=Bdellovibrio sp. HCB274 TaxID=3394361 RepID=UPI0039B5FF5F